VTYDDALRDAQTDELKRCRDPRYSSSPFRTASDLNSIFPLTFLVGPRHLPYLDRLG